MKNKKNVTTGALTAMITPMKDDGRVDYKTFEKLLERQYLHGIRGIVVLGTTAETPTLDEKEQKKLVKIAIKRFGCFEDTYVVVGTGTNCTKKTVENTKKFARDMGADAALVVTPYYNKPNENGLIMHFAEVSKVMPIIVYDIKGRTARQITIDEFKELAKMENVIGFKAASGDIGQITELINKVAKMSYSVRDKRFYVWSGDDNLTVPVRKAGGDGVISVISNLVPELVKQITVGDDWAALEKLAKENEPVAKAAFVETNPVPIKHMMWSTGLIESNAVRLPLGQMSDENKKLTESVAKKYFKKTR
ncbi:MAG: 4-hydroxy-tetrahydrodipicolinate synthase [Rickettsiales bacterium]|jgi:4-hydroxy-tetrahydrodipicolinate synthase|nr:4-hydroxy-tetrahydrodipicolinate synthase [Rickettsiales bacterium]